MTLDECTGENNFKISIMICTYPPNSAAIISPKRRGIVTRPHQSMPNVTLLLVRKPKIKYQVVSLLPAGLSQLRRNHGKRAGQQFIHWVPYSF